MAESSHNQNMPELIDTINMVDFKPGSEHLVHVTHINDPRSFYVRLISVSRHLEMLEARGDRITSQQVEIRKNVIYRSKILQRYVRGTIQTVNEKTFACSIFASDYGCYDVDVILKKIYLSASTMSRDCPPLAVHCQLYSCEPKQRGFDAEVIDTMKYFTGKRMAKICVYFNTDDRLVVELKTSECPDDVSTMLAYMDLTMLSGGSNIVNRLTHNVQDIVNGNQYLFKAVKVGEKLTVRVQTGSSIEKFHVADINDYKKYIHRRQEFTGYCRSRPLADIDAAIADRRSCGIYIIQNNFYERGIVFKHTTSGNVLTKLVDTGEVIEVPHMWIKDTPSNFFSMLPYIAIYCSSTDNQTWKTSLPKFLYPGYEFMIEIVEVGDGLDEPHKVNLSPANKL